MTKVVSARVDDVLAAWLDEYAAERGRAEGREITRQDLVRTALMGFRDECERGVPELREKVARRSTVARGVDRGVGQCPNREPGLGHVWRPASEDPSRGCRFCALSGRLSRPVGQAVAERPNDLGAFTSERAALFAGLRAPMVSGSGDPKKAARK